jgi:hypothetical protein
MVPRVLIKIFLKWEKKENINKKCACREWVFLAFGNCWCEKGLWCFVRRAIFEWIGRLKFFVDLKEVDALWICFGD